MVEEAVEDIIQLVHKNPMTQQSLSEHICEGKS